MSEKSDKSKVIKSATFMPEVIGIEDIVPDDRNLNLGTEQGMSLLETSLRSYGAGRSILIDKNNRIIAGNRTTEQAYDIGMKDVVVVESDGTKLIAVKRVDIDLDTKEGRELAISDNVVSEKNLLWDPEALVKVAQDYDIDVTKYWSDEDLVAMLSGVVDFEHEGQNEEEQELPEPEEEADLTQADIPDALFGSDNDWDIPTLDINMQARSVDLPAVIWGSQGRKARMSGTWLFYTEDYRFQALWNDPSPIINTRCKNIVEPNLSCYDQTPRAVVLYRTYQKRWISRLWQSHGIRVFVDMNVATEFYDINLVGVPHGWKAYATRGYNDRTKETIKEYEIAVERAGGEEGVIFLVYGGGKKVRELCGQYASKGWVYANEDMDVAKGVAEPLGGIHKSGKPMSEVNLEDTVEDTEPDNILE